jgi:hypothetical protein
MTRPGFVDGVCLVANAVVDVSFRIDISREIIDTALAGVVAHDATASIGRGSPNVLGRGEAPDTPAVPVPGPLDGDWLDGWAAALAALAGSLPLAQGGPRAGSVAVVGLLLDRREADRQADRDEVVRMLAALGLDVCATWPALDCTAGMVGAGRAATLLALPHGLEAARILAARTGARVVATGLPIGLAGTADCVRQVGRATGTEAAAEAFVDAELDRIAPRLEWVVPHGLLHRRLFLGGDAPAVAAWAGAFRELGCEIAGVRLSGGTLPVDCGLVLMDAVPTVPGAVDLCIGDRGCFAEAVRVGIPALERGFPCPGEHFLLPAPALGFEGLAGRVEAAVNRISLATIVRHWRQPDGPSAGPPWHAGPDLDP